MVKKLLKHEFIYYFRTFGLFLPIVLVIAAMARVFRLFDNDTVVTDIAIFMSTSTLVVSCAALLVLSTVVAIVRFYKNMYSAEGYLTLTLPVTNAQHIFVKLFVAMICQAVCLLTVTAAGAIVLSGEALVNAFRETVSLLKSFCSACGVVHSIGYSLELILLIILAAASSMLLYYACITVGQTAKKNRILKAIGAYFIYYIATQVVATVFMIVFAVLAMSNALDGIAQWIIENLAAAAHIYLCGAAALYAVLAAAFWLVTQIIMTKKLNLE